MRRFVGAGEELLGLFTGEKVLVRAGMMTSASPVVGTFGAVNVDRALEHRGKERFLKNEFLLPAVYSRLCRSCIQMPATSEQLSTK